MPRLWSTTGQRAVSEAQEYRFGTQSQVSSHPSLDIWSNLGAHLCGNFGAFWHPLICFDLPNLALLPTSLSYQIALAWQCEASLHIVTTISGTSPPCYTPYHQPSTLNARPSAHAGLSSMQSSVISTTSLFSVYPTPSF